MSTPSKNEFEEALRVVALYRGALVRRMAQDIVEHKEDFESPFVGSAEALIDKYYHSLQCLCPISENLRVYAQRAERSPPQVENRPLAKDEFRCFRCRSIIPANAESCSQCGWTWG